MLGISDEPRDRSDEPLARVHDMGERVLNRPTAGCAVLVINVTIRGTVRRKVLAANCHDFHRLTWQLQPTKRANKERERMTNGEGGDDLQKLDETAFKPAEFAPPLSRCQQRCGQQQHQQKEQVIGPFSNVMHPDPKN